MIQLAVGMAVGIILIVGLIWPVVDDSTNDISSIEYNETNRYSSKYDATMDILVNLDSNNNLVINGEVIEFTSEEAASIISDKFFCSYNGSTLKIFDSNSATTTITITELTISDGKYSYTSVSGTTDPQPITRLIYPDNDGNLGAFVSTSVNVDYGKSVYFGSGGVISGASQPGIFFVEYSEGEVIYNSTYLYDSTSTAYVDKSSVSTYEPSTYSEYDDYYKVNTYLNYDIDGNSGSYGALFMYAPLEYHVVTDMDNNIRTMIAVAGMLIVVLMVVMVARNLMD